jgi:GTPase
VSEDLNVETASGANNARPGYRCGFAAIVGRPNVGKSTLLNTLLGRKLSIVSPKPQTTRHRILGILTQPQAQVIFVDTPGLHSGARRAMNRHMNRAALASLQDADVNLFVVEALRWTDEDQRVLDELVKQNRPVIAVLNKADKVFPKERLLPFIEELNRRAAFVEVVPLSALKHSNTEQLPATIARYLPESPPHFPDNQLTDRSEQFQAAEIVREKLTLRLRQELPYGLTVIIEQFKEEDGRLLINAVIWVERSGQKAIVIGNGGEQLKEVGRAARIEMSELFKRPVHLELWVKVKENWSDNETALRQLGYEA